MLKAAPILCLALAAALSACGPKGDGPSIPSTSAALGAEGDNPGTDTDTPATDNSAPFDATVAHRLLALPTTLQDKVKACEATGKFYNLGDQICTETALLAAPPCVIDDTFRAALDPTTLPAFETYLAEKVNTHRLYACTEDGPNFVLHFYKYENAVVNYKKLNIAKKPS